MRLIHTRALYLEEFEGDAIPQYAILSHTWRAEEVLFHDWENPSRNQKAGWRKVEDACRRARLCGFDYLWIDTVCIDKKSSAELSEAINSMYMWYGQAGRCLVFLDDFHFVGSFEGLEKCRWFTRGWTLQELLAPYYIIFYDSFWTELGYVHRDAAHYEANALSPLVLKICDATQIAIPFLCERGREKETALAERMLWAAHRQTTRVEDLAYCLMGLFDVNMPLLYGEGGTAFIRLQEEIIKHSSDESIFAWTVPKQYRDQWLGCLAPIPAAFLGYSYLYRELSQPHLSIAQAGMHGLRDYALTNIGLRIKHKVLHCGSFRHHRSIERMLAVLEGVRAVRPSLEEMEGRDYELPTFWLDRPGSKRFNLAEDATQHHSSLFHRANDLCGTFTIPRSWLLDSEPRLLDIRHQRRLPKPFVAGRESQYLLPRMVEGSIGLLPLYQQFDHQSDYFLTSVDYAVAQDRFGVALWLMETGRAGIYHAEMKGSFGSTDPASGPALPFRIQCVITILSDTEMPDPSYKENFWLVDAVLMTGDHVLGQMPFELPPHREIKWVEHLFSGRVRPLLIKLPALLKALRAYYEAQKDQPPPRERPARPNAWLRKQEKFAPGAEVHDNDKGSQESTLKSA